MLKKKSVQDTLRRRKKLNSVNTTEFILLLIKLLSNNYISELWNVFDICNVKKTIIHQGYVKHCNKLNK